MNGWPASMEAARWQLSSFANLRELRLEFTSKQVPHTLSEQLQKLTNLTKLELVGPISKSIERAIYHLTNLEWLMLAQANIALARLGHNMPALTNLRRLELHSEPTWKSFPTMFPKLRILRVDSMRPTMDRVLAKLDIQSFPLLDEWNKMQCELVCCQHPFFDNMQQYPITLLHAAATSGILEVLKFLLGNRQPGSKIRPYPVDIEARHPKSGSTALLLASKRYRGLELIQYLHQHKANMNSVNKAGSTALSLASKHGNTDEFRFLLANGAQLQPTHAARLPFIDSQLPESELVELVQQYPSCIYLRDPRKSSLPVHAAARLNHPLLLAKILDIAKADGKLAWMINATDADLQTCLHTAASKSAREVAEILVEHEELGINATDVYGYTPVIHAVSERADVAFHLVELLLRHPLLDIFVGHLPTLLHRAIQGGYLEIVERLLEKHELEFYCDAPTMHAELLVSAAKAFEASPAESIPIIKLLLQHGCDVTARTADGNPLFASALGSGMFDDAEATSLVKALLIAKADPTLPNLEGETPLSIAVDRSWRFAVMELVQAGVDIKSDYHLSLDRPLLQRACYHEAYELAQYLIQQGADVNALSPSGKSALTRVLMNRSTVKEPQRMRLTKLLVSRGASIHIGNPPPLVAAVVMQCPTIVKYLLTLGADVNCKDRVTGTTPLYAALINVTPKMNDVLDILLTFSDKHDPNVTPPNMTPLIFRALSSYQTTGTIVKAILALPNIDVNIRCPKTNSYPIHNTIWGNSNLEQLLACPGLDVNIKDGDGNTALHLAARSGALGISLLLAHPGIDFLVENSEGRTALQIAELDAPYIVHEFHEAIAKRTK